MYDIYRTARNICTKMFILATLRYASRGTTRTEVEHSSNFADFISIFSLLISWFFLLEVAGGAQLSIWFEWLREIFLLYSVENNVKSV